MARPATTATPLGESETSALTRALRNLHRELRSFLAAMPVDAQSASGLARRLDVERTTCQRVVSAANQASPGLTLIKHLPGVAGMRMIVNAAGRLDQAEVARASAALSTAIDAYEQASRRIAPSRARLLASIDASPGKAGESGTNDRERSRTQLFESAAALTGRYSETWLAMHIYEPADDPKHLIQTRAHGLIGHVAREDAVPLTFHVFGTSSPTDDEPAEVEHFHPLVAPSDRKGPAELLRQFSTRPFPVVRARQPNEFLVQTIDANPAEPTTPFDLVFGMLGRMVHPGTVAPFVEEVWALVNFPVRWLLMDVFLRRDLARTCVPGLDVHLWRPDFASQVGERWQTRFSTAPRLQLIRADLEQAASPAYGRSAELQQFLFEQRGLEAADFVGYRCEVAYPMWRTGYRMTFDFGQREH